VFVLDDLGYQTELPRAPRRVLSLVPSITESVAATNRTALVGATDWCTHPADLEVARVRGTKNPDLGAIRDLEPDLVIAAKEENRKVDVDRLRAAGVPVWVTDIQTLDGAFASLGRLFTDALHWPTPRWLNDAQDAWREPPPEERLTTVIPIWRDPWMVVGSSTFAGDVVSHLGLDNVYADHSERYPHMPLEALRDAHPEVVLLPDEPYAFSARDGPESFPGMRVALVEGRSLTWYGPSLVTARARLLHAIAQTAWGG
jgi:ABC-type Fe3+-hydroxamate transport system substrate-binding protein